MRKLVLLILVLFVVFGCASTNHCDAYRKSDMTKHLESDSIDVKKFDYKILKIR